jgi:predicted RNase H-like nuclease
MILQDRQNISIFPLLFCNFLQAERFIQSMKSEKSEMDDRYLRMQSTLESVTNQNKQLQLSNQSIHASYRETAAVRAPSSESDEKLAHLTSISHRDIFLL